VSRQIPLVTNATKIVKYSKACHLICAGAWQACHNLRLFWGLCSFMWQKRL